MFAFPGTGGDEGLRWLVVDRDATTVVATGIGATTEELRDAIAAAGA